MSADLKGLQAVASLLGLPLGELTPTQFGNHQPEDEDIYCCRPRFEKRTGSVVRSYGQRKGWYPYVSSFDRAPAPRPEDRLPQGQQRTRQGNRDHEFVDHTATIAWKRQFSNSERWPAVTAPRTLVHAFPRR
jgi:hypothetical protein